MSLVNDLSLDDLGPADLWAALDADTKRAAGHAAYRRGWDDGAARAELDEAIAGAINFRMVMLRKQPVDKRVDYLLRAVRPDDGLASTLLLALHVADRRPMLAAFLDALGVPHDEGMIDEGFEPQPFDAEALGSAAEALREKFPPEEIELYLASLLALDPEIWGGLRGVLEG